MKLLVFVMIIFPVISTHSGVPTLERAQINEAYIPEEFNEDANVAFVVTGWHENSCVSNPIVEVDISNYIVDVKVNTLTYDESNPFCPIDKTKFKETVRLGKLLPGSYELRVNEYTSTGVQDEIVISESNIDKNILYPQVQNVTIDNEKVVLDTFIVSDCLEIKNIDIEDDGENTYSVTPILHKVRNFCPRKMQPYQVKFDVPQTLDTDKALLHIKSRGGESINKIIEQD